MKPGEMFNAYKKKLMKKKNWIANAIKKPGALHKELGIKAGKKIPAKTLAKAATKGGKEGKRARLAETLKSFHKSKKKLSATGGAYVRNYDKFGKPGSAKTLAPAMASGRAHFESNKSGGEYIMKKRK